MAESINTDEKEVRESKNFIENIIESDIEKNSYERPVADMYSFGLILWEIARRCVSGGKNETSLRSYSREMFANPF